MTLAVRVAIDARLEPARSGGVAQWVMGVAGSLARLPESDDRFLFITYEGAADWLSPYLGGGCELLELSRATTSRIGERMPALRTVWQRLKPLIGRRHSAQPGLDGLLKDNGIDVVHFPYQDAFDTALPYLYQPWDLQHLHLPGFFTEKEIARRESEYRRHCARSSQVIVASEWTRRDVIDRYGMFAAKVSVVNVPPVNSFYPPASASVLGHLHEAYDLPEHFFLYPAQTYPHKNHLALVRAVAHAKELGIHIDVVCTGNQTDFFATISDSVMKLGVADQLRFLGFVSTADLQGLYSASLGLVFPSLFEGWGLPIFEAFAHGKPVACSDVALLPDLVADAALVFDPHEPREIAEALVTLQTNGSVREEMAERGRRRVAMFKWQDTAVLLRAHYRQLAGISLEPDEIEMLGAKPLV